MIISAIEICKKLGIHSITGNFIIGGAFESRETNDDFKSTIIMLEQPEKEGVVQASIQDGIAIRICPSVDEIRRILIDTDIYHIGDDNYSNASANASQFRSKAVGPVYRKSFFMPTATKNKTSYLVIGSIIGIDTALARGMGQNNITTSFASPPKVFFNGQKIAEIQINGDNQKITLNLLKA